MRSRQQTIAIILSRFKKKFGHGRTQFSAKTLSAGEKRMAAQQEVWNASMERIRVRDEQRMRNLDASIMGLTDVAPAQPSGYPFPPLARKLITPWKNITGEFLIAPDGQAISGSNVKNGMTHQALLRTLGMIDSRDSNAYGEARKAGFVRGRLDPSSTNYDNNEQLSLDIPFHKDAHEQAKQFIKQTSAKNIVLDLESSAGNARQGHSEVFTKKYDALRWLEENIAAESLLPTRVRRGYAPKHY